MKTITTLTTAAILFFSVTGLHAQSVSANEEITAETFIRMENNDFTDFAVGPLKIENAGNGFAVKWQTMNDNMIVSFEVQISEDKNKFTTIKKVLHANSSQPAKLYAAEFNNTIILSEKAFFRVKSNLSSGASSYSDIAAVKIRQAK